MLYIVGVLTRGLGSQLVNAACFLVPDDDARGNHSNARFILVPAAGPYVQQRGCARALYYLAPEVLVVGDTSEVREGEKLPSLYYKWSRLRCVLSRAESSLRGKSENLLPTLDWRDRISLRKREPTLSFYSCKEGRCT